jgi:ribosomal RNA methyltransferase Nop2
MGVNGQKRKNKQGPVPTLEESLRKKPRSDKPSSKGKAKENGTKGDRVRKSQKGQAQKPAPVIDFDESPEGQEEEEMAVEEGKGSDKEVVSRDFSATKASLFDDAEDLPEDEFTGIEDGSEEMYPTTPAANSAKCRDDLEVEEDSVFDSDEDGEEEATRRNSRAFSDSDDDEEELTAANMEALSAKLDTFAREDILAAQDELLNPVEPVADGVLLDTEANEDLSSVRTRIMEIVRVLGNFKNLQEEGVKRKDYVEKLVSDISGYYSYNTYLARKFLEMFSVAEV